MSPRNRRQRRIRGRVSRRAPWDWVVPDVDIELAEREAPGWAAQLSWVRMNSLYKVQCRPEEYLLGIEPAICDHLFISRTDGATVAAWHDLQRIKDELCEDGPLREAVQVFPASEDLVDVANVYHLFVLPLGLRLPFWRGMAR